MSVAIRGLIEGFYGTPWTWDERIEVSRHCAERGMTHYVYAPKDDPKHRERWRELYGPLKLVGFERLIAEGGLTVGFAISPGLDIDFSSDDDRRALFSKVDQVVDVGITLVVLALDDIAFDPAAGPLHAELTMRLADHLAGRAEVALVPTEYVGMAATGYLGAIAAGLAPEIPIAWTGAAVVNDSVTVAQAHQRAEALGGRAPLLWDNYPVNDGLMADRLQLGPLWGREAGLLEACCGYLANPMTQPRSSMLPLASAAAWLRGDDPLGAWVAEAGTTRVFAEACDGAVPQALAGALADEIDGPLWADTIRPVAEWMVAAKDCTASGLELEAGEWLEQVHAEARLGLRALRLVQACSPYVVVDDQGHGRVHLPQPDDVMEYALALAAGWPALRRSIRTVMGARCAFRPVLEQRSDGAWRMVGASIDHDRNAVDSIVVLALALLDEVADPPELGEVLVEGERVEVAADGSFEVAPGSEVLVSSGTRRTLQRTPCGPPIPDTRPRVH